LRVIRLSGGKPRQRPQRRDNNEITVQPGPPAAILANGFAAL
jgi:hypothetical protein